MLGFCIVYWFIFVLLKETNMDIIDTTPLALLTVGQFIELVKKCIESPAPIKTDDTRLDMKETRKLTGYSADAIYRLVRERKIPCYRLEATGKLWFKKNEIMEWIDGQKVKTIDEMCREKLSR